MTVNTARMSDQVHPEASYRRPAEDAARVVGMLRVQVHAPDGTVKYDETIPNLVTTEGDRYYGERGAGIAGAPAVTTGMQLGTGTTAVSKTGAGAAIVTLVAASLVAHGTPTSALSGTSRRIQYVTTWAAGVATATGISEVVLTNQATATQTAAPAANTIARALLSPVINKGAGDSLTITWSHDILGS